MAASERQARTFVVGSPVGGGVDIVTRIVARALGERLGEDITIDNVTGSSAMIGSAKAAQSPADGKTLLMVSSQFSVLPSLYPKMPYDTLGDFVTLSQVATSPLVLAVPPELPVNSVNELIALGKKRRLKYASAGVGGSPHLAAEAFKSEAQIDIGDVLYEGAAPSIRDLLAGRVDLYFGALPSLLPYIQSGKLKALGVTTKTRAEALPQVPTIAEAGLASYEYGAWFGALAPRRTPADVVERLGSEIAGAIRSAEVRAEFSRLGYVAVGSTPEEFAAFLRAEMARWNKVIQEAGIKAE